MTKSMSVLTISLEFRRSNLADVRSEALSLLDALCKDNIRAHFDDRSQVRPGAKYHHWELKVRSKFTSLSMIRVYLFG